MGFQDASFSANEKKFYLGIRLIGSVWCLSIKPKCANDCSASQICTVGQMKRYITIKI